jgi:hypothetical protein
MFSLTRIQSLVVAGAFVAITAAYIPALSGEPDPRPGRNRASRAQSHGMPPAQTSDFSPRLPSSSIARGACQNRREQVRDSQGITSPLRGGFRGHDDVLMSAQGDDGEAAVGVPGIAASVLALEIGVEVVHPLDRLHDACLLQLGD